MTPGEHADYVLQRDFERYTTAQDKRWDALIIKVDSLADSTLVDRQRILGLEKIANEKSSQSFTSTVTAAQAGLGCLTALATVFLSFLTGITGSVIVYWLLHH